ncbi:MAG TPA: ABC transporter substrate-binding protein [Thermoanaerobaculia bacterium]|nr:ABC transporter substrate-binding protein [Thermoanaerobaculia bacterium]
MKRSVGAWAVAVLLVFGGCARSEAPVVDATLAGDEPRAGGTLYRRLEVDIASLNPVLATSRYDRIVAVYLFTPLIQLNSELRPAPGLAESWQISADGRTYTFHLNPRATFADGKPVRAADVVFTLRKTADPEVEAQMVAAGFELLDLSKTRALNDHTVQVTFREALASQLVQFHNILVLPEHVYSKGDFRDDFNEIAVGSGPYRLVRIDPGREIVVQRRDDYWGRKPWIETVVLKVVINNVTAWNAAKVGEIDETMIQSDVWLRERNNRDLMPRLEFLRFYGLAYNYIAWNGRNPLFRDKRVRRALGMCLDVRSIIADLYGGTARAMNGHFVPEQWAFNPAVDPLDFNPAGAKDLLATAGWTDSDGDGTLDREGQPFRFVLTIIGGSPQALAIAQSFQGTLKKIGVQAELAVLDGAAAIQRILAGNYEAAYLSWDLDPDPDPYPLFHGSQIPPRGQNFVFYDNPEANRLIEQGRRELKMSKRAEIYQQLHAVLAEDQPYTWVTQPSLKWVINRRVMGVREGKGWGLFLWHPGELDWWLPVPTRGSIPIAARAAELR